MLQNPRLVAGMARQANLSALDAMIAAARAGGGGAPHLADLAADLAALAARTAKATERLEGTSGTDDIAATLTAMRDAAIGVTEALRQQADATAADRGEAAAAPLVAGNATNG